MSTQDYLDDKERLHREQALTLLRAWWRSVEEQVTGSFTEHRDGGSIKIDLRFTGAPEDVLTIIRKPRPEPKDG